MVDRAGFEPATFRTSELQFAKRTIFGPRHTRLIYRPTNVIGPMADKKPAHRKLESVERTENTGMTVNILSTFSRIMGEQNAFCL